MKDTQKEIIMTALLLAKTKTKARIINEALFIIEHEQTDEDKERGIIPK